jgi:uncharacterized heparinase superfamily protein
MLNATLHAWARHIPHALGGAAPPPPYTGARIIDPWPGDAGAGRALVSGFLTIGGAQRAFHDIAGADCATERAAWAAHLHGFAWLRDLRALGGPTARRAARALTARWLEAHPHPRAGPDPIAIRPDVVGARLALWYAHRDFVNAGSNGALDGSAAAQARCLAKNIATGHAGPPGPGEIRAGLGLAITGLTLDIRASAHWRALGLEAVKSALAAQILPDGGHVSRSPAALTHTLRAALATRCALTTNGYPVPPWLAQAIERMGPALRFFRCTDKGLALFHGAQEGSALLLDGLLTQAGAANVRVAPGLAHTGFERLAQGRSVVLMDVGAPPPAPYDSVAHAAPLAFSFCYGAERVFTACGTHPLPGDWREALRATPAHCTLTLGNRGACEIGPGHGAGFTRRAGRIAVLRDDAGGAAIVEACHDGYVPVCGVMHRRRLFLTARGADLRGEEILTATTGAPPVPVPVAVRFHLHPRVSVALVREGAEALLRIPGGEGWRFTTDGARLALENSVYLGTGVRPRKTKQIVLHAALDGTTARIRWALRKADIA